MERTLAILQDADEAMAPARRLVGRHIYKEYFGEDEKVVRSRYPLKPMTYKAMRKQARVAASWSDQMIRRTVQAEITTRSVGERVAAKLTYTHLYTLYFVDDVKVRKRLAQQIFDGDLVGDEAQAAIDRESKKVQHGGRWARPAPVRAIARVRTVIKQAQKDEKAFAPETLRGMEEKELKSLRRALRAAIAELQDIDVRVQTELDT